MISIDKTAISTLKIGLDFYEKFLMECNEYGDYDEYKFNNIRFATISIHNVIELLSKKLLSDIDNFLILELNLDSDEELAQRIFFHYKRRKNEKINMMHSLISEKCRTIDYNKCIKIIYNMFNNNGFNSKDKDILDGLGKIRNSLVHIGGNEGNALYKIMILLNDSLQLITGFYRDNIEFGNEVIGNSLMERIDNIINTSKEKITNLWLHSEMGFVQMILGEIIDEIKKKDSI